jgi:hypothetical protein
MAFDLFANEKSGANGHRRGGRYSRCGGEKSSNSAAFTSGKIIPSTCTERLRNDWNGTGRALVLGAKQNTEDNMYIGLGGILLLILILWLLGVI